MNLRRTLRRLKNAWAYFKWAYSNDFCGEYTTILELLIFKLEREIEYYKSDNCMETEEREDIIKQIQRVVDKLKAVSRTDYFDQYLQKRAIRKLGFPLDIEECRFNEKFQVIYKDPRGNDPKYRTLVSLFYRSAVKFEDKITIRLMREALREINTHIWGWWD